MNNKEKQAVIKKALDILDTAEGFNNKNRTDYAYHVSLNSNMLCSSTITDLNNAGIKFFITIDAQKKLRIAIITGV